MVEMAKRGKMRQVAATISSQNVVKIGWFYYRWQIAANHSHREPKNRHFTFVKSYSAMPDEQAAAKGGRMLLWRLWHHTHELEFMSMKIQSHQVHLLLRSFSLSP